MGLITEQERYEATIEVWDETRPKQVTSAIQQRLPEYGSRVPHGNFGRQG